MTKASQRTFSSDFRRFFLRGLVVLLPTVLTLWIMVKAYQFVDTSIAEPINQGIRMAITQATPVWDPLTRKFEPTEQALVDERIKLDREGVKAGEESQLRSRLRAQNIMQWWDTHWYMDLIGIIVAVVGVYIAGRLLGGFFGRQIYRKIETIITTLPVFKQVYPYVKQVVDFLFSDDKPMDFNSVVVVEYPRKGIWAVGFQTGNAMKSIAEESGDSVTIFIPSSPTPFTGYTITVPRDSVRKLPISVEEAIRFSVSGGVLIPEHQIGNITQASTPDTSLSLPEGSEGTKGDESDEIEDNKRDDTGTEGRRRNAS